MEAVSRTPNNDDNIASSASQGAYTLIGTTSKGVLIYSHVPWFNSGGPGIEGFQIVGEATPGNQLLGCGYPVRGTSLCMFQVIL